MTYEYRAYCIMPGQMPDIQRRFADNGICRPTAFSPPQ
jgi:hypothetical protein